MLVFSFPWKTRRWSHGLTLVSVVGMWSLEVSVLYPSVSVEPVLG